MILASWMHLEASCANNNILFGSLTPWNFNSKVLMFCVGVLVLSEQSMFIPARIL